MDSNQKKLYSKGEEIFNGVSHIVGGALGVIYLVLSILYSVLYSTTPVLLANIAFASSMIVLYVMSSLYHMLGNATAKKVFQIFDHCSIFLLISGTYTPLIIMGLPTLKGYIILAIVWFFAILGIVLNATLLKTKTVKIFSYITYILMGWCIVFIYDDLIKMNSNSLLFLFLGGIIYSIGFIFYGFGKKKKWFHSIWHLFVLFGTISHFVALIFLMLETI